MDRQWRSGTPGSSGIPAAPALESCCQPARRWMCWTCPGSGAWKRHWWMPPMPACSSRPPRAGITGAEAPAKLDGPPGAHGVPGGHPLRRRGRHGTPASTRTPSASEARGNPKIGLVAEPLGGPRSGGRATPAAAGAPHGEHDIHGQHPSRPSPYRRPVPGVAAHITGTVVNRYAQQPQTERRRIAHPATVRCHRGRGASRRGRWRLACPCRVGLPHPAPDCSKAACSFPYRGIRRWRREGQRESGVAMKRVSC